MSFFGALRRSNRSSKVLVAFFVCAAGLASLSIWSNIRSSPVQEHITSGVEMLSNNQSAAAESQGRAALQLDPHNAQAWELVGNSLLQTRDIKGARAAFERALREDSNAEGLREKLATCALAVGDIDAARRFAEEELKQNPDSVRSLQLMANVARQSKQSDEQVLYLQKVLQIEPENVQALAQLVDELGRRQEYDKALPLAKRLVSLQQDASSYYLLALALYTTAVTPVDVERAKSNFEKVLELDPTSIEAHRFLGRIALRQNQPRVAIREFEAVGQGRPYASAHLLELSNAYRRVGNTQKADQLRALFTRLSQFNSRTLNLKKAIDLTPDNVENYVQLSQLLIRGIESDESLYQLCRYRYVSKDSRSVQEYIDEAKQRAPRSQAVQTTAQELERVYTKHLRVGLQAFKRQEYQAASQNLSRAALLRPNDPRTLRTLKQVGFDPFSTSPMVSGMLSQ